MANVHDVAAYILSMHGRITTMKLEKLVYYSQAWFLVATGERLFPESIKGWKDGPVAPELYRYHANKFEIASWSQGDTSRVTHRERTMIDAVSVFYGSFSPEELSKRTHDERPWQVAREGLAEGEHGKVEIRPDMMIEYYKETPEARRGPMADAIELLGKDTMAWGVTDAVRAQKTSGRTYSEKLLKLASQPRNPKPAEGEWSKRMAASLADADD